MSSGPASDSQQDLASGLAATMTVVAMGLGYAMSVADPTILSANMSQVRIGLHTSASTASFIASLATLTMAATVLGAGTLGNLYGMRVSEGSVLSLKNNVLVTANIDVPEAGANGVIVTQGGNVGGWTLYAHDRKLKYCYNFFGIEYSIIAADEPLPAGKHQVHMEFAYEGGGLAKGGNVTLYYDGKAVGEGRVDKTQPLAYSADEACDVGADTGSPASPDYGPTFNKFTGRIDWVQIDIDDDNHDHLIKPEDRFNIAMARQ